MSRLSLKVVGASGQGINSIGEILAKGLKRSGYCVFGYREYPSLIKGGHASYQLDVSHEMLRSSDTTIDLLLTLNHHGLELNLHELKQGAILLHSTPDWQFSEADKALLEQRQIRVRYVPVDEILSRLQAKAILGNVVLASFVWSILGQGREVLREMVREQFGHKKALLELNMRCIDEGTDEREQRAAELSLTLGPPDKAWADHLLLTGSHAMGLGAVHAGVRLYAGYPMTPSSPLLSYIAEVQNDTGMVIKQAEDEITAAQIVSGAMFMGTRALTGTSGGGFDLMSETLSLNGIIENPTVFVLAQRPGPATGLPTWTGQGDLLLAVNTGHGEYARCVLSASDSQDAFDVMPMAFNIAEEFQISVIVLTDKQIAEALYTQKPYDQGRAELRRGKLVTDPATLATLKGADRYDPSAEDGVSPRWLPGTEADTYCAQGDEHNGDGTVDEGASNAVAQMDKRMRKLQSLHAALPDPELYGATDPEVLLVGWGSTKGTVLDALERPELRGKSIGYLHFTYLWPLKTELFTFLTERAKKTVLIEGNHQGQLGLLIAQQTGILLPNKILKYDGRPFFRDELARLILPHLDTHAPVTGGHPLPSRRKRS